MERLPDTTVADLQRVLESVDEKKPTQRLIAAIAYKNGITQSELAEWFNVERKTIYNWLSRLEEREFETAVRDEPRPGRPRKLSSDQLAELEASLQSQPTDAGYDAPAWTTDLVQQFIRNQFETNYSRSSCRRLMKEAGLSHQTPRTAVVEADRDDRDAFEKELANLGHLWMPG